VVEPKGVAKAGRGGVIEEVLQQEPPRYRVRWDDGRESIIAPASGAVRVEASRPKAKATRKKTGARS
jgi:hypothetical protein